MTTQKLENMEQTKDERISKVIYGWICAQPLQFFDYGFSKEEMLNWLENQGKKKSADEVLKIRQELYQSGYNDGYKHGQEDITMSLEKESIEALEHFVRGIAESGYASPYDNRTKLIYRLLNQLKQMVK